MAHLVLVGWVTQAVSGATFGMVTYYFYHQLPDISGIAVDALGIKMVCVSLGILLLTTIHLAKPSLDRTWEKQGVDFFFCTGDHSDFRCCFLALVLLNCCYKNNKAGLNPAFVYSCMQRIETYSPASTGCASAGRSISSIRAIGALSPLRKPNLRMRE